MKLMPLSYIAIVITGWSFPFLFKTTIITIMYLTFFPRKCAGYVLLDSGRGAKHRVGYHKLIPNMCEWNNCYIKYQTLDQDILNFIFYRLQFSATLMENYS